MIQVSPETKTPMLPMLPGLQAGMRWMALMLVMAAGSPSRADDGPSPSAASPAGTAADRMVHAVNLVGTPYHRHGSTPETGFDCSGFVLYLFRTVDGIALPRTADEMFRLPVPARAAKVSPAEIEPGDLVFFRIHLHRKRVDHVGLALGDGRFVHAPARGGAVRIDSLGTPYWSRHFVGARRVVPVAATPAGDVRKPADDAGDDPPATDQQPIEGENGQ